MSASQRTLAFLLTEQSVLLGLKKRGFGRGKFLGIGGKVEAGESIEIAAQRELYEEIGVSVEQHHLLKRGLVRFKFPTKSSWDQDVHLFVTTSWNGTPTESEEIEPGWFTYEEIPYQNMWDDARYWLPHLLKGEAVSAEITFADDLETVKTIEWRP